MAEENKNFSDSEVRDMRDMRDTRTFGRRAADVDDMVVLRLVLPY